MNAIVIQVNGRYCCVVEHTDEQVVNGDFSELLARQDVKARVGGFMPLKFVTVPRKLINIVTREPCGASYTLTEHADGTKTCDPPFPP